MITRIELTNFMSHDATVIEPAAGLTVLSGPNNCGKSAVVAALQILCHNDNSTYVLRHDQKECSVQVTTDDGHTIEWRRKKSPSYLVDGQLFDRLKESGLPPEVHNLLRLPLVDAGSDTDFDVHFGTQKQPIFLLANSPAAAAKFFASSSDAVRLVEMIALHKNRLVERKREKNRLEAESTQLTAELELLEPAVDLDRRLTDAEQLHAQIVETSARIQAAERHEVALRDQAMAVAVLSTVAETLSPLAPPPALPDPAPLVRMIRELTTLAATARRGAAQHAVLETLPAPPAMADTVALQRSIERLIAGDRTATQAGKRHLALAEIGVPPVMKDVASLARLLAGVKSATAEATRWQNSVAALAIIAAPPVAVEIGPLTEIVSRLAQATAALAESAARCDAAIKDAAAAEAALRSFAAESTCAACGSPFDPDRVVARAVAGLGGHEHE